MTPLFIIGNPRSGTSILRLMLTSHPEIIISPESHFFLWLEEKYGKGISTENFDNFLNDLYGSTKFETWEIPKERIKEKFKETKEYSYAEIVQHIYLTYGKLHGKSELKIWGDKNKLWKEKIPRIDHYFPEAKFIHIVRDGRDVACSFRSLQKLPKDLEYVPNLPSEIKAIAERWSVNLEWISGFFEEINENRSLVIKYEDLIVNTIPILEQICDFLDLRFSHEMLNYREQNAIHGYEPDKLMHWKGKLTQPLDTSNIGKYKNLLTEHEIKSFTDIAFKELKKFNYE